MSISPDQLLQAFAEILSKRALLDTEHVPKLIRLALKAGVYDSESLRQWVNITPKLTNELRSELLNVLRPPRQRVYGDFTIVGHLADGGMGDVWLAIDSQGDLGVIKTLLPELHNDEEFVRRFQREAQITAGFKSPYLVRCLDSGHANDQESSLYITLEYVSGGDLHNLICARTQLGEIETLRIGRQIALALEEASRLNLVHRDLKPENILITANGDAKLVDFGLARTTTADRTVLTLAGSTLGTPDYMSPEQIYGDESLDIRSDIYALGCVLYFCLAGHPPYEGDSIEIMKNHISGPIPDIRRINKQITKQSKTLIERCMAKKREARFANASELAEACGAAMERKGTQRYDTTMRGIKRSDMLPPAQFSSDSIMDLAELDLDSSGPIRSITPLIFPPEPANWLLLSHPKSGLMIHLFAKEFLLLGKLRASPIDICLRNYPKSSFAELNNRVSRQHAEIRRHDSGIGYTITDIGSTNGLILDGTRIPAHTPWPIPERGATRVQIPKSVTFALRCYGKAPTQGVIVTRPDNHPQIMYALVNGAITIGGDGCDLPITGELPSTTMISLRPHHDGWEWRDSSDGPWAVLNQGETLQSGSLSLESRWGNHNDFA